MNKAEAISAKLLELNSKNKLGETGNSGKKLEEIGRKKRRNWRNINGAVKLWEEKDQFVCSL